MRRSDLLLCFVVSTVGLACDDSSVGDSPCTCANGEACDESGECPADAGADMGEALGCTSDGQCADDEYCAFADDLDVEGTCEEGCRTSTNNCDIPEVCDGVTHTCQPACSEDEDCEAGSACIDGACSEGSCRLDPTDCAAGEFCDPDSRECMSDTGPPGPCCVEEACEMLAEGACGAMGGAPAEGDSCEPDTCVVAPECEADGDCADDEYCDDGGCAEGCRRDPDNCPVGEACGGDRSCAEIECEADGECPEGEYCLVETGECSAPCGEGQACPGGFFCDADARCTRGCRDSEAEDNDSLDDATALELDGEGSAEGADHRICPLDPDWYAVPNDPERPRVRAVLSCPEGQDPDIGIELHDADGLIARVNEPGCAQELVYPSLEDDPLEGPVFLVVSGGAAEQGNDYTLEVSLLPAEVACAPDEGEEDDEPGAATDLVGDAPTAEARTLCAGDDDWYSVALSAGDGLTIELSTTPLEGGGASTLSFDLAGPGLPGPDFDPADADVLQPNQSVEGEDGAEVVSLTLEANNQFVAEGVYYLRVRGTDAVAAANYDLSLTVDRVGEACVPDAEEPNEANPTDLMAREGFAMDDVLVADQALEVADLSLCRGDVDRFRVVLAEGDVLAARLAIEDAEGEPAEATGSLSVSIENGAGEQQGPAARATDVGPEVNARSARLAAGEYFVRVEGAGPLARAPNYGLTLIRTPGDAPCADDRFDGMSRNDDEAGAALLELAAGEASVEGLNLCNAPAGPNGDHDVYRLELAEAGRLQVDLTFATADGDLQLEVFPQGGAIVDADTDTDNEQVVIEEAAAGTWFVRVSSFIGDENTYDLSVSFSAPELCDGDALEDNDAREDATELASGFDREVWICQGGDRDWYSLETEADTMYTLHLDFLRNDNGWVVFDVHGADGNYLRTIEEPLNGQCLVIEAAAATTWYFAAEALSFDIRDATPDRAEYRIRLLEGDQCAALEPLLEGVEWPRL